MLARRRNGRRGNRLIGCTTRDLLVCTAGRECFLAAEENGGGEKTKDQSERDQRKLSFVSYCAQIRSSCERKLMKSRMGTEIDFKKTGSRGFHERVAQFCFISSAVLPRHLDL